MREAVAIGIEILNRLSRSGVLSRTDAFEYLANNRSSWVGMDEEGDEPFHNLLEKLDQAVLGLVEALDADSDSLPQLLDEALNGSLWARQVAKKSNDVRERQLALFTSRAELVWSLTTGTQRRGHFAMGVGLEVGLSIDAMADELAMLVDKADEAALVDDLEVLITSLAGLAERLLAVRPFALDDPLPMNWRDVLAAWISGTSISDIGPDSTRLIEDAFTYRLVWALEAIRTRRLALGWEPNMIAGTAAACLETGMPQYTLSLIHISEPTRPY